MNKIQGFILYRFWYGDTLVYLGRTKQPLQSRIHGHLFKKPMMAYYGPYFYRKCGIPFLKKHNPSTIEVIEFSVLFYSLQIMELMEDGFFDEASLCIYDEELYNDVFDHIEKINLCSYKYKQYLFSVLWFYFMRVISIEDNERERYNTGSMILAMENAGNLIEDSELREQIKGTGIGTSATRAEILKKLEAKGYLNVSKKTQIITPHEDGEAVYDILKEVLPDFLSPQMTAEWEKKLDKISHGTMDYELHQREVEDYVKSRVEEIKNLNNGENYEGEKFVSRKICKCPVCKAGIIVTRPYGYSCSNYKKEGGCSFAVGKVAGVSLSEAQIRQLATAGKTEVIHKFKSKNGKIFPAVLVLDKEEDKVNIKFQFDQQKPEYLPNVKCPLCEGRIKKTSFGYGCSNYRKDDENSCRFQISRKICGKQIPENQLIRVLCGKESDTIKGFKSKKGTIFSAKLKLNPDGRLEFIFEKHK